MSKTITPSQAPKTATIIPARSVSPPRTHSVAARKSDQQARREAAALAVGIGLLTAGVVALALAFVGAPTYTGLFGHLWSWLGYKPSYVEQVQHAMPSYREQPYEYATDRAKDMLHGVKESAISVKDKAALTAAGIAESAARGFRSAASTGRPYAQEEEMQYPKDMAHRGLEAARDAYGRLLEPQPSKGVFESIKEKLPFVGHEERAYRQPESAYETLKENIPFLGHSREYEHPSKSTFESLKEKLPFVGHEQPSKSVPTAAYEGMKERYAPGPEHPSKSTFESFKEHLPFVGHETHPYAREAYQPYERERYAGEQAPSMPRRALETVKDSAERVYGYIKEKIPPHSQGYYEEQRAEAALKHGAEKIQRTAEDTMRYAIRDEDFRRRREEHS